ncbi:hypothetical protein HDU67_010422 [Dinochytrium kinnereticum]|nr:hypothetical protein HDU67_010422 [Dinochytrium kinnereticum]
MYASTIVLAILGFAASVMAQGAAAPLPVTVIRPFTGSAFRTGDQIQVTWAVNQATLNTGTFNIYWQIYPGGNPETGRRGAVIAQNVPASSGAAGYTVQVPSSIDTGYYAILVEVPSLGAQGLFYSPMITITRDPNVSISATAPASTSASVSVSRPATSAATTTASTSRAASPAAPTTTKAGTTTATTSTPSSAQGLVASLVALVAPVFVAALF